MPDRARLIVQARFSPVDANDRRIGQKAMARFPSLHDHAQTNLTGQLTRPFTDALLDKHSGQGSYPGKIGVASKEVAYIQ